VLNDETSALFDSFQDDLLAPPVYTRPAEWEGMKVPEVLLSGHEKILPSGDTNKAPKEHGQEDPISGKNMTNRE
jgi:tRNA (guanine-N1)-methyltransferase